MLVTARRGADTSRGMKHKRSNTPNTLEPERHGVRGVMLWPMIGLSGFACLVYQILWMRQLGLLFGNTAQAAALTLAVFFAGLAAGAGSGAAAARTSPSRCAPAVGWNSASPLAGPRSSPLPA
jgi:hypothetical protein